MSVPKNLLIQRRQKLFEKMDKNSALILFSNQLIARNADVEYPFRQDSNFYYLTGIDEDCAVYFLKKDLDGQKKEILFIQEKTYQEEIWTGMVNGREKTIEISGVEEIANFFNLIPKVELEIQNLQKLYFDPKGSYQSLRDKIGDLVFRDVRRSSSENLIAIQKLNSILKDLRMYKEEWEIEQIRQASEIAIEAHIWAVQKMYQNSREGKKIYEYQVCGDLYQYFAYHQCTWSYPAVVAGGQNACILHYTKNDQELRKEDMLLIDAGCEYRYYASDITRCYPVSGGFSQAQKAVYELVLKANLACIAEVGRVGSSYSSYHDVSVQVLTQGLLDLGLLEGSLDENIEKRKYFKYYMHGVGHWLGLDVHDTGVFLDETGRRPQISLLSGMTLTVEPGLYFDPRDESIPAEFRGVGVRIEDDVLKTENGVENLTAKMPKTVLEIENLSNF